MLVAKLRTKQRTKSGIYILYAYESEPNRIHTVQKIEHKWYKENLSIYTPRLIKIYWLCWLWNRLKLHMGTQVNNTILYTKNLFTTHTSTPREWKKNYFYHVIREHEISSDDHGFFFLPKRTNVSSILRHMCWAFNPSWINWFCA